LSAVYRQVDGVNALKEQLSGICFRVFWRCDRRNSGAALAQI